MKISPIIILKCLGVKNNGQKNDQTITRYVDLQTKEQRVSRYLFFDVETTGLLPKNYRSGFNDKTWPKIVQAAWIVADEKGNILKAANKIVSVDIPIPEEVVRIHGITNEIAREQGVHIIAVLTDLINDLKNSKLLICHNIAFDLNVLRGEVIRTQGNIDDCTYKSFCTMNASINYCNIFHPVHIKKWPSLSELYERCFNKKMVNAHDASVDVEAVHKIFFHLKKKKIFKV